MSKVTNMQQVLSNCKAFTYDIGNWNVSSVENMVVRVMI